MNKRPEPLSNSKHVMKIIRIHRSMTRNVFLHVELLLNDGITEICEYDIQSFMFLYFLRKLNNTPFHAQREQEGKVDCVVYEYNAPKYFYEIKTYFKYNEKLKKEHLDKDIEKIRNLLLKSNDDARGYIFIAGKQSKFSERVLENFMFISAKLNDDNRRWFTYKLPEGHKIRLRPSVTQRHGRSVVITWEVKL